MPKRQVFVSYSSADKAFAERLVRDLERVGIDTWFAPWEIGVGDSILDRIEDGIARGDRLLVILSPASVRSRWVRLEVNAALMRELEGRRIRVLPVLYKKCSVPVLLRTKKWADFAEDYDAGFADLLAELYPAQTLDVLRRKDFRTVQYLVSGLSGTDDLGSNILRELQVVQAFRFRDSLVGTLSPSEERLLFWTAVGFRSSNPQTPWFLHATAPVWGLVEHVPDDRRAKWIIDGLGGRLFDYLVAYYHWASRCGTKPGRDCLKKAYLLRTLVRQPVSATAMGEFLKAVSHVDPDFFTDYLLSSLRPDTPVAPLLVEATSHLPQPPPDAYYHQHVGSPELGLASLRVLAGLRKSTAVAYCREWFAAASPLGRSLADAGFNALSGPEFRPGLADWLEDETEPATRLRIATALRNSGGDCDEAALDVLNWASGEPNEVELLASAIRLAGRSDGLDEEALERYLLTTKPVVCEAALFALCRRAREAGLAAARKLLRAKSRTIVCAAAEALGRFGGEAVLDEIVHLRQQEDPMIRSSFYAAVKYSRPEDLRHYGDAVPDEDDPLVLLCAGRALTPLADETQLASWLSDDRLGSWFRVCVDERLYCRAPFMPSWLRSPLTFCSEEARLGVRLTNFDPEKLVLDTHLDLDRMVHTEVMGEEPEGRLPSYSGKS